MFDEMHVMASRGLFKVVFKLFLLHHYFTVLLLILSYHSILSSDLGSGTEKCGLNLMITRTKLEILVSDHWQESL